MKDSTLLIIIAGVLVGAYLLLKSKPGTNIGNVGLNTGSVTNRVTL
jgi:hypothetical protein